MERRDWLLVFIGAAGGPHGTDQIRVMKGLFLLSKEGPSELRDLYDFEPYAYGPFDKRVYHDLDQLELAGAIEAQGVAGTNRRYYRLTAMGQERCARLRAEASVEAIRAVDETKSLVTSMGFMPLLRYVYERHPDFAINSTLRR